MLPLGQKSTERCSRGMYDRPKMSIIIISTDKCKLHSPMLHLNICFYNSSQNSTCLGGGEARGALIAEKAEKPPMEQPRTLSIEGVVWSRIGWGWFRRLERRGIYRVGELRPWQRNLEIGL